MKIDIATLFPELCEYVSEQSIVGRAQKSGAIAINCHNIRDYTKDKHRRVDDSPYGGGKGMVMQVPPIVNCFEAVTKGENVHCIYMSPQGKVLTQERVKELAKMDRIFVLCGHYEGVDERAIETIVDEEISIGDYVLTGGELPALILVDAIARLCPGVLSDDVCFEEESHYNGLLEYPQYTRPQDFRGKTVPEVLMSGNHKEIERFRTEEAKRRTIAKRPDLIKD